PFERRYAWHVPGALDVAAMRRAAALVEGEHDFAAFQSAGSDVATTVRTVAASALAADGPLLLYEATADGFLRHMVRAIVGSLVETVRVRKGAGWTPRIMAAGHRSRAA